MEAKKTGDANLPWPREVEPPDTSHFHVDTYASSRFDLMKVLVRLPFNDIRSMIDANLRRHV